MTSQSNDVDVNVGEFPDTVCEERPLVISEFHFTGLVNSILNGSLMDEHGAVEITLCAMLFRDDQTQQASETFVVTVDCVLPNNEVMSVDLLEHMLEMTGEAVNFPYTSVQAEISIDQLKQIVKDALEEYDEQESVAWMNYGDYVNKAIGENYTNFLATPIESLSSMGVAFSRNERQTTVNTTLMLGDVELRSSSVLIGIHKP